MGWFDRILRSCSHRAAFILRLSTSYLFRLRQEKIVKGDPPHGPRQRYFPRARQQLTEAEQGWKAETSPWGTIDRNCVCSIVSGSLQPWASVSIWFHSQEYWRRLPFFPPGDLSDPAIEPSSTASPSDWQADSYHWAIWEALEVQQTILKSQPSQRLGRG